MVTGAVAIVSGLILCLGVHIGIVFGLESGNIFDVDQIETKSLM